MPTEKKYSLWPAILILTVAFGLPTAIGTMEIRVAHNAHAEFAAVQQMQAIAKAESAYYQAHRGYSATLEELKDLPKPDADYAYHYAFAAPGAYTATAEPTQPGKRGRRYFFMSQDGVLRYEIMQPATAASAEVPPPAPEKR